MVRQEATVGSQNEGAKDARSCGATMLEMQEGQRRMTDAMVVSTAIPWGEGEEEREPSRMSTSSPLRADRLVVATGICTQSVGAQARPEGAKVRQSRGRATEAVANQNR